MPSVLHSILGPEGSVARRLGSRYEHRPQQMQLAEAIQDALNAPHHLMAEAGTGTGKSFAYLLPAIDFAVREKKRVVIATHTIALQEQIIDKDIPLLRSVYPDEFTAVLVKGRGNYLCQRRLEQSLQRSLTLFPDPRQVDSLGDIYQWSQKTTDGSLSDLPHTPPPGVWDKVNAEQGNCLGKKCKFYANCHWQSAKRRMQTGNILVVNHALFFSDLALRMAGVQYLPKYDAVIFDEAHSIEDVAASHFGLSVSESQIAYNLRVLHDPQRGKGLLVRPEFAASSAIDAVDEAAERADDFFTRIANWQQTHGRPNGRVHEKHIVENDLSPKLHEAAKGVRSMLVTIKAEEDLAELTSMATKIDLLAASLEAFVSQGIDDAVYWIDKNTRSGRPSLHAAPVNVSSGLRQHLFERTGSVIMTSATMCTAKPASDAALPPGSATDAFAYMRQRLGAESAHTLAVGSPFDYASQATLFIEGSLPDPGDVRMFLPAACNRIAEYLSLTNGGAFVLFTSYRMLRDAADRVAPMLKQLGLTLLVHGTDGNRKTLLDRFRVTPNAVLFGTSSFWQGIDVQGDALRNVIIVKLPFEVPDEPVVEARLEAITRTGGNPFMAYSVPQAVIKLKQGFGRLIRSKTDKGIVVILDSRVKTRRYGRLFIDALPPCRIIHK